MSQVNLKKKLTADTPSADYVGLFYSSDLNAPAVIDENGTVTPFNEVTSYVHTQASASATWTVNHNLGFVPACEVYSSGGAEVDAEVVHTSVNQTIIYFVAAFAGSARFN